MFAIFRRSLAGEPWLDIDDARLELDYKYGCDLFTMSLRARRPKEEVLARLKELGLDMEKQPRPKKRRSWIGH